MRSEAKKPKRFAPVRKPARHTSRLPSPTRNSRETTGDLRSALYVSDLNRAYQFWDAGNVQRVEELLERHRPSAKEDDLRGVEWHYLRRLATPISGRADRR